MCLFSFLLKTAMGVRAESGPWQRGGGGGGDGIKPFQLRSDCDNKSVSKWFMHVLSGGQKFVVFVCLSIPSPHKCVSPHNCSSSSSTPAERAETVRIAE